MTFVVDAKRAELVLDAILDRYKRGAYPYNVKRSMLSEFELPKKLKRGGEAEARFWFFACMLMRGGIDSDTALAAMSRLYDAEMVPSGAKPFDPKWAAKMTPEEMSGLIMEAGTGLFRLARDWVNSAQVLVGQYNGRVLKLVDQIDNYETALQLIRKDGDTGFPGFQHKMVSMLLFFLIESDLMEYFPYPPPVDFHLIRVAIATGLVKRKENADEFSRSGELKRLQEKLRWMYLQYISSRNVTSNEVSDAVWLLSRMLCRYNPGNKTYRGEYAARSTEITPHKVDLTFGSDQEKFERSCGRCPVRGSCGLNVPSAYYYTQGKIITSERIDDTPVLSFELTE